MSNSNYKSNINRSKILNVYNMLKERARKEQFLDMRVMLENCYIISCENKAPFLCEHKMTSTTAPRAQAS